MVQPIFFVTGTDTDVGKTFISSLLVHKWKANYWKPVQTGIESDVGDSFTISKATVDGAWQPIVFSPRYELLKPLSPYKAMEYEPGVDIKLSDFKVPDGSDEHPLIVEGAGGVLVPLTRKLESMTDLMNHLLLSSGRPFYIVVVTRSGLGTLNHTLLTVKYLQDNGLGKNILGVIINGQENKGNTQVMKDFGVPILAEVGVSETVANAISSIPPLESLPFGSP